MKPEVAAVLAFAASVGTVVTRGEVETAIEDPGEQVTAQATAKGEK